MGYLQGFDLNLNYDRLLDPGLYFLNDVWSHDKTCRQKQAI